LLVEDDGRILAGLCRGDERVFSEIVGRWGGAMLRLALVYVGSRAVAEEVVQEAWLAVLGSVRRFEGRSALRTWVLGVVVNTARSRARAERRSLPVAVGVPCVDPARFHPPDAVDWPDHWRVGPVPWPAPEEALLAGETRRVVVEAIAALPGALREVLVLRDLEGMTAAETCAVLGLSDVNQRVMLHRARARVRLAIEEYFDATELT
jgi:RNA polymerase sigma-70 factor (ECF subfamily)